MSSLTDQQQDDHDGTATKDEDQDQQRGQQQRWFPLESNPTLINWYIQKLGFDTSQYEWVDVFSVTEDWALEMVPQPVAAVMLLYPLTEQQLQNTPKNEDTTATPAPAGETNDIWFMKQRIGNACGTIGLIHAIANVPKDVAVAGGLMDNTANGSGNSSESSSEDETKLSWLQKFFNDTRTLDPIQKAERLEADGSIAQMHDAATSSLANSTDRGEIEDDVETHFIALVESNGILYELDGRKQGPIPHGPTSSTTLLKDACRVIQKFMSRDPNEVRFAITALAPKQQE